MYFFNVWGTCCKKKHYFLHFFWHFPPHFTKQKMHDKFKKSACFCILPYITQQKSFFQQFFDETIFNFPNIITNSIFFLFFMLILQQTSKKTSKKLTFFLCTLTKNEQNQNFSFLLKVNRKKVKYAHHKAEKLFLRISR